MVSERLKTLFVKVKNRLCETKPEDIAKFAIKEVAGEIPIVGQIIKDAFDEFSPDEKRELINELKDLSETQFKEISEKIGVSHEYLRDIQKIMLYTFEELKADNVEIKGLLHHLVRDVASGKKEVVRDTEIIASGEVTFGKVIGNVEIGVINIGKPSSGEELFKPIVLVDHPCEKGVEFEKAVSKMLKESGFQNIRNRIIDGNRSDITVECTLPYGSAVRYIVSCNDSPKGIDIDEVNQFYSDYKTLRKSRKVDKGIIVSKYGYTIQGRQAAIAYGLKLFEYKNQKIYCSELTESK